MKKDRLKRKQRFENVFNRNQVRFERKHENEVKSIEKREEKFSSFLSSRFETNGDQRKEKEKEKIDVIHKNLEQAAQVNDKKEMTVLYLDEIILERRLQTPFAEDEIRRKRSSRFLISLGFVE